MNTPTPFFRAIDPSLIHTCSKADGSQYVRLGRDSWALWREDSLTIIADDVEARLLEEAFAVARRHQ